MRVFLTVTMLAGLGVLALGHAGQWIALGDSLAVVRPFVLLAGVVFGGVLWLKAMRWQAGVVALALALSGALTLADFRGSAAQENRTQLRLYQKNLLWNNPQPELALADIRASGADIITLQETSSENAVVTEGLKDRYPYHFGCASQGNGGIAILSRFPLEPAEAGCEVGSGIVIAQADVPGIGPVWIGSVHLNWPYPFHQSEQIDSVLRGIAGLDGPKIIAGDFNMVPWGSAVRRIAAGAHAERLGGYGPTYVGLGDYVPLVIDHVLIPEGWTGSIERRPLAGADHYGLFATFAN